MAAQIDSTTVPLTCGGCSKTQMHAHRRLSAPHLVPISSGFPKGNFASPRLKPSSFKLSPNSSTVTTLIKQASCAQHMAIKRADVLCPLCMSCVCPPLSVLAGLKPDDEAAIVLLPLKLQPKSQLPPLHLTDKKVHNHHAHPDLSTTQKS
jgi:hypothetical protein